MKILKYSSFEYNREDELKEELNHSESLIDKILKKYPTHIKSIRELLDMIEKDFNIHPSVSRGLLEKIINSRV